jgi:hypothetical protein
LINSHKLQEEYHIGDEAPNFRKETGKAAAAWGSAGSSQRHTSGDFRFQPGCRRVQQRSSKMGIASSPCSRNPQSMAVIDAARHYRSFFLFHSNHPAHVRPGQIDADAQTDALDFRELIDRLSVDRERIGKIVQHSLGAQLLHVPGNLYQNRHMSQSPPQSARA